MIGKVRLSLHFPGDSTPTEVTHLLRDGSSRFSERLFNADKRSVQDTFSFSLKHDQSLVEKVRSAVDRVLVSVTDYVTNDPLFTGALDPSATQSTAQVAESIGFEAVDSTWRLDFPISNSFSIPSTIGSSPFKVCDPADIPHSIFHQVCYMAGYTELEVTPTIASLAAPTHCAAIANDETFRDFLDTLLFEHKLVLDDDGAGHLVTRRWARIADGYDDTIDSGELSTVVPFTWSRRYVREDGARVEWSQLQEMPGALLYRDSLPVSPDGIFTGKAIAAGDYYPPDSDIEDMYQSYVENWLDKPYLERRTRIKNRDISLVATDGQTVAFTADAGIGINAQSFEPHRALVRFRNTSSVTAKIYTFEIQGKALYRNAVQKALAPVNATNPREYTSRFIFSALAANELAKALALDAVYGDFEYTFGLNRYVQPGTIVRIVSEKNGIDTEAVIQDCIYEPGRPVYQYVAVGIAEWTTAIGTLGSGSSGAALWPIIQAIDAQLGGAPTPPTNNVTNVVFTFSPNADGSVHVAATWDYVNGTSRADLAYVYVKASLGSAPGEFDYGLDKAEAQPMSVDGPYGWSSDFPARTGGSGGAVLRYRFGVVASLGVKLHEDGAVTPIGWEDKQFIAAFRFDDFNYWDLGSGELRAGNATNFIKVTPAAGALEISGLDLELTESELITRADGVELSHEGDALVWREVTTQDELARSDGKTLVIEGAVDLVYSPVYLNTVDSLKYMYAFAESSISHRVVVAIDTSGRLCYSDDGGKTWSTIAPFISGDTPMHAIYCEPLGLFIVVISGKSYCYTSSDGAVWTTRALPISTTWIAAGYDEVSGQLFIISNGATRYVATSLNGITWGYGALSGLTYSSYTIVTWIERLGLFAMTSSAAWLATSTDGLTWTETVPPIAGRMVIDSPELGVTVFIAASNVIATSTNLVNFSTATLVPSLLQFVGGYWDKKRRLFVLFAPTRSVVAISADGYNWKLTTTNVEGLYIDRAIWLNYWNWALVGSKTTGSRYLLMGQRYDDSIKRYSPSPGFISKDSTPNADSLTLFDGSRLLATDAFLAIVEHFIGASSGNTGVEWAAIASGTQAQATAAQVTATYRVYPVGGKGNIVAPGVGIRAISSSTTANSGGSLSWAPSFMIGGLGHQVKSRLQFVLSPGAVTNRRGRWGFMNTFLVATPTFGIYFNITTTSTVTYTVQPTVLNNSVATLGTALALTVSASMTSFEIEFGPEPDDVTFLIQNGENILLKETLKFTGATAFGEVLLGAGCVFWSTGTSALVLALIDTMAYYQAGFRPVFKSY